MDRARVPKFGSFKPKVAAQKTKTDAAASDGEDARKSPSRDPRRREHRGHRHERERRRHHHGRDQGRSHDERGPREERRHRQRDNATPRRSTQRVDIDEFEESHLFIIDRRGDAKNVEYGSLHRYGIPAYHRTGYGNVIGLPPQIKINREASSDKDVILTAADRKRHTRLPRLLTGKHGRSHEANLRYVLNAADTPTHLHSDYVDLRPSRKRKRNSESPEAGEAAVDYRSIEGKAKAPTQPADEDLDFASESETGNGDDALELPARQQNAMLSKTAKAKPGELDSWLTLAEHQAKMVQPGVNVTAFTSSERRTLADLRLSILHQAASHINKGHPSRDQLLLSTIEEGSIIWDGTKLSSRWKEALVECPSSVLLWTRYLDHIQDQHAGFRYDQCKASFVQCMDVLRKAYARCKGDDQTRIWNLQVHVLLRLTTFIRDAGYSELAVAIWQALLEYHLCTPNNIVAAALDDKLESFESFWESEVPRIGEPNARGWHRHHEHIDDETRRGIPLHQAPLDASRPWASFARQEKSMHSFCLSALPDDDDAITDPFRCVMFSDIRDILESLSAGLDPSTLADGFLAFLELPALPCTTVDADIDVWRLDPHNMAHGAFWAPELLRPADDKAFKPPYYRQTCKSLFGQEHGSFANFRSAYGQDEAHKDVVSFVDRSLEALVVARKDDDVLAEYYLAFKLSVLPEEAVKAAKKLLKEPSSSSRLYNAYALIEARLGHEQKAETVWSTALAMQSSLGVRAQDDAVFLWHSRMLNAAATTTSALQHLLSIDNASPAATKLEVGHDESSVHRLKASRKLQEGFDRMMLQGKQVHAASYADCLAWLAYLSSHHDFESTFQAYEKCSSRMSRDGARLSLELLQQCKADLIKRHIELQRPYKPAVLRGEMENSLSLFPSNSILIELAQRLAAQDRLRTLLHDQKATEPNQRTIVQWAAKITGELHRTADPSLGSTANTVRATFASALLGLDSKVTHAPALWFMWLRFECNQADGDTSSGADAFARARQVFLDGLRYLPWHKHWAIAGMDFFSERGMSQGELRQIHDTLVDRGLRLRVDVEEVL
ncbi:Nuclear exosome regulator NRDE2 [Fulvia fulva]|uniref:Nuclear exosome regulator NRDE2 n=1 Tax=Passalora fulva TaxID=5499 RepID=A0A9Q8LBB6_PASFU|nr:Nuclear exosome regulator NRDE2 [Fulvia fulva]UJO14230.1 Nuclear exosome regulator NRDE2 [Fulvia fulva]WPV11107.1 Nuclear exosome regulator NRDE2 [Fulvia fulva]